MKMNTPESKLEELGLTLPEPPTPVGAYLPLQRSGNLLFLSGVLPMGGGKLQYKGKLGLEYKTQEGFDAAALACLNALAILKKELGSLDKVKTILKVTGYVASSGYYYDHPKVVNGASELLVQVFGERGKHARAAVGCISLPLDSPVEIEMIVEVGGE